MTEKINELSKKTLRRYVKKSDDEVSKNISRGGTSLRGSEKKKHTNRVLGHGAATDRLRAMSSGQSYQTGVEIAKNNKKEFFSTEDVVNEPSKKTISEISKQKAYDYIAHASIDKSFRAHDNGRMNFDGTRNTPEGRAEQEKNNKRHGRRSWGIQVAASKLAGKGLPKVFSSKVAATEETSVNEDTNSGTRGMNINELSKKTLGSYVKKAGEDMATHHAERLQARNSLDDFRNQRNRIEHDNRVRFPYQASRGVDDVLQDKEEKSFRRADKRHRGIGKAVDRLTKENADVNEDMKEFSNPTGRTPIKVVDALGKTTTDGLGKGVSLLEAVIAEDAVAVEDIVDSILRAKITEALYGEDPEDPEDDQDESDEEDEGSEE